jgi:hypothetical protein
MFENSSLYRGVTVQKQSIYIKLLCVMKEDKRVGLFTFSSWVQHVSAFPVQTYSTTIESLHWPFSTHVCMNFTIPIFCPYAGAEFSYSDRWHRCPYAFQCSGLSERDVDWVWIRYTLQAFFILLKYSRPSFLFVGRQWYRMFRNMQLLLCNPLNVYVFTTYCINIISSSLFTADVRRSDISFSQYNRTYQISVLPLVLFTCSTKIRDISSSLNSSSVHAVAWRCEFESRW